MSVSPYEDELWNAALERCETRGHLLDWRGHDVVHCRRCNRTWDYIRGAGWHQSGTPYAETDADIKKQLPPNRPEPK